MNEPLDELYLTWLYDQVGSVKLKSPRKTYWSLIGTLFKKEFVWLIPNDDNRVEDGKDLRYEFIRESGLEPDPDWMEMGCSILEMMYGVARRLAWESDREPRECFWFLVENLELADYNDGNFNDAVRKEINEVLDQVVWRTYHADGRGGLFPLEHPTEDQREVEIWYQLCAYLLEHE